VQNIQRAMRDTLESLAPEWAQGVEAVMPASPRTFAKFVGRPGGAVGGVPRRAGLDNYAHLGPHAVEDRLWLVGDSVFPGQSALATAIGGVRTASAVLASL
jgi:phytoene dehydrogenase-like protein